MRVEAPAARRMPATGPFRFGMCTELSRVDGVMPLGQVPRLTLCRDREKLGDNANRYLLRTVGTEVEAHGAIDPVLIGPTAPVSDPS